MIGGPVSISYSRCTFRCSFGCVLIGLLFDNTTPIYLINLLWKLGLGLGLDSYELQYFSIFYGNEHLAFREFHGRQHFAKRTHPQHENYIF